MYSQVLQKSKPQVCFFLKTFLVMIVDCLGLTKKFMLACDQKSSNPEIRNDQTYT